MKNIRKYNKSAAAFAVCIVIISMILPVCVFAVDPLSGSSAAYRQSKYCESLQKVKLIGNHQLDVVNVALSQKGYHEGNSEAEFGGENTSGNANFTEYNRFYGKLGDSYSYSWYASFVYWCMRTAGVTEEEYKAVASSSACIKWLKESGKYYSDVSSYSPICGDLIFFYTPTSTDTPARFGLVITVDNGTVYTVEGASNDSVEVRYYAADDAVIAGYGQPNYSTPATSCDFSELIKSVNPPETEEITTIEVTTAEETEQDTAAVTSDDTKESDKKAVGCNSGWLLTIPAIVIIFGLFAVLGVLCNKVNGKKE